MLSHRRWAVGVVGITALIGMVTAFGTVSGGVPKKVEQRDVVEELSLTANPAPITTTESYIQEDRIRVGDTVASLLDRLGAGDDATIERLRGSPGAEAIFRQMSPGKTVIAQRDRAGHLQSLTFPLNGGGNQVLSIKQSDTGFQVRTTTLPTETQVVMKSAEIRYSLFGATDAVGIPDAIAIQLADIFGGEIDFHRDLRKGDRFSVVYESIRTDGKPIRTGRILAAEFTNGNHRYQALWFGNSEDQDKGGYYTPEGESLRKAFLRSPLEFSRVTSGFSSARFHPVLQQWRAHKGVDYGAAIGTRVRATAAGMVDFVGVQGGYGKVVILRHQGHYSTLYGHLSRFASGLKKGDHVSQGELIAFTGASGLASGPHLHYEFRMDGIHQNPLTVALPETPPLTTRQFPQFHQATATELARLGMLRDFRFVSAE
ncbi:MAG: M23 family metallopeptidase [Proteobacteria bacterium]|nr:M23 family metallopeptidase [Pseudomonadota bacterium]HQR05136.1 M23 family metallopeptidase [Rhodocyclaceae bacterium]